MTKIEIRRHLVAVLNPLPRQQREDYRASHLAICETCGYEIGLHPVDPEILAYNAGQPYAYMHVLCNGDRVKT